MIILRSKLFGVGEFIAGNQMMEHGLTTGQKEALLLGRDPREVKGFWANHAPSWTVMKHNMLGTGFDNAELYRKARDLYGYTYGQGITGAYRANGVLG